MATLDQITADVNSAKVYSIKTLAKELLILKGGGCPREMDNLTALKRVIRSLTFQINAGVNDADTNTLYNCLLKAIRGFSSNYNIDPTVKIPGQIINVTNSSNVTTRIYPFSNATDLEVLNYQTTLLSIFGPNPEISLFVVNPDGSFSEDTGTTVNKIYAVAGDATSGLISFNWQYALPTTGYYQITGIAP